MMSILTALLELFFQEKKQHHSLMVTFVGYFLIIIGIICGGYFLFNYLALQIGYFEAGGVICAISLVSGLAFLFFIPKKKSSYLDEAMLIAKNLPHELDIVKSLIPKIPNTKNLAFIIVVGIIAIAVIQRLRKALLG